MTYDETLNYLYESTPVFQQSGASAYKPGLTTSQALDDHLGNPHKAYKKIHIAGTNGKGSVSHLLAATLQKAGYRTGLYTSPHLLDFRERIRVNGEMIFKEYVVEFVEKYKDFFEPLHPSFFELTATMAFDYFRHEQVDFAIIETGLGGRLDSTNIITPVLSIITNISFDHKQFLGETLPEIAREKAGIIKPLVPVVIGELYDDETENVFAEVIQENDSPGYRAQKMDVLEEAALMDTGEWYIQSEDYGQLFGQLGGAVQYKNYRTVLAALRLLTEAGVEIPQKAVREAFEHVVEITGLRGRWETIQENPLIICDTGHNEGAWPFLTRHLEILQKRKKGQLYMIIGMAEDKDVENILYLMPENAYYYFTQASVRRAMPSTMVAAAGLLNGLTGVVHDSVEESIAKALKVAGDDDVIFIGGSTFVVADALAYFAKK